MAKSTTPFPGRRSPKAKAKMEAQANAPQKFFYYMACMLMFYTKDEKQCQRHINVLIEAEGIDLTQKHLAQMQRTALARIKTENNVDPEQVQDAVILNMSPLGHLSAEEFSAK